MSKRGSFYWDRELQRIVNSDEPEYRPAGMRRRSPDRSGPTVLSTPTDYFRFRSMALPKNYKHHAEAGGSFGPNGECEFHSRAEVERTLDRANAHGESIVYPGRGGVNRYAD